MMASLGIIIPTLARERILTYKNIPKEYLRATYIACPNSERTKWEQKGFKVFPIPDRVKGIGKTRAFILKNAPRRFILMLDDDMDFCYRPSMRSPKLLTLQPDDASHMMLMRKMLQTLEAWLDSGIVHVGISARQGNNHIDTSYRDATRMMNAYAYDTRKLLKLPVELGRMTVMEDLDLTLQLLRLGYINRVTYQWCWNQRRSGARGGCSTYRTGEMQAKAAEQLASYHPGLVRVVQKTSLSAWDGMRDRLDVRIAWRKALPEKVT